MVPATLENACCLTVLLFRPPVVSPQRTSPRRMPASEHLTPPSRLSPRTHQRGRDKIARNRLAVAEDQPPTDQAPMDQAPMDQAPMDQAKAPPGRKPSWIRAKAPLGAGVARIRRLLRDASLATVCEEAQCPNLGECFAHGTATFMILGDLCTRRCPFCDVAHGRPQPPDAQEPERLAEAIATMGLRYVVLTSVDRDDLRDGGAGHFAACLRAIRARCEEIRLEVLVPDFRGRETEALEQFTGNAVPDVFNHNLETVPRLYQRARPGADYRGSLALLGDFKQRHPEVLTKSGLMVGIGETRDEVLAVMRDLRAQECDMLTIGQYLQPSTEHLPVREYWPPDAFVELQAEGEAMGFASVASGAMVRSSYHADRQHGCVDAGAVPVKGQTDGPVRTTSEQANTLQAGPHAAGRNKSDQPGWPGP